MKYEFAVKQDTFMDGTKRYVPVVRELRKRWFPYNDPWQRIVCLYGQYFILDINWFPPLSIEECEDHIKAFQETLANRKVSIIGDTTYLKLQQKEI